MHPNSGRTSPSSPSCPAGQRTDRRNPHPTANSKAHSSPNACCCIDNPHASPPNHPPTLNHTTSTCEDASNLGGVGVLGLVEIEGVFLAEEH